MQLVRPDASVAQGARAVFESLAHSPGYGWLFWLYCRLPLFAPATELGYRLVAANRNAAYWVTVILFGKQIVPATYRKVEWLFLRWLGAVYLAAFASFGVQVLGLVGSQGILPLQSYLPLVKQSSGTAAYWVAPTLFWLNASDTALRLVSIAGAVISVVLIFGFAQRFCLAALFLLYLSLCTAGQDFMSFQWDMLLLEAGFLAIFLGSSPLVVWLFRWLLFRLMFLSGAVKLLSNDPAWWSLDALRFHYWTQPLPTPLAWYMNRLPAGFQHASTVVVFCHRTAGPVPHLLSPASAPLWARGACSSCRR